MMLGDKCIQTMDSFPSIHPALCPSYGISLNGNEIRAESVCLSVEQVKRLPAFSLSCSCCFGRINCSQALFKDEGISKEILRQTMSSKKLPHINSSVGCLGIALAIPSSSDGEPAEKPMIRCADSVLINKEGCWIKTANFFHSCSRRIPHGPSPPVSFLSAATARTGRTTRCARHL